MITVGSVSRDSAAALFPFLAEHFPGRRSAIRELTHRDPEFVFWIYPDGRLHDARRSHRDNVPRGHEHILKDEPDYCGFLRGRVVRLGDHQLIVVYCRPAALAAAGPAVQQLMRGLERLRFQLMTTPWLLVIMRTFMGQLLRCFGVRRANPAGAGNGAAAVLLHFERTCRAVPDQRR